MEKKKRPSFTTPKGTALFAHIFKADFGTEKFPIKDGQYSVTLVLSSEQSDMLKDKIRDEIRNAEEYAQEKFDGLKRVTREKLGKLSFQPVCQKEYNKNDEETGNFLWRFKTAYQMEDKNTGRKMTRVVPCFDSLGIPVHLKDELGNGSILKISFTTNPYFVEGQGMGGLSMYLNAVQILKFVKWGERNAESYGFSAEENGFTSEADSEDDMEKTSSDAGGMEDSRRVEASEMSPDIPF